MKMKSGGKKLPPSEPGGGKRKKKMRKNRTIGEEWGARSHHAAGRGSKRGKSYRRGEDGGR